MAQRRMFSPQIVESEEFLVMPVSSQALYFHLGMNADDDGFIQPKIIMRQTGAAEDDLKVLLAKRFLLSFETGVVVIKHWLIHNLIQKDRYHPTRFQEEKKTLIIKDNKAYTDSVNRMLTEVRLGKDKLVSETSVSRPSEEIIEAPDEDTERAQTTRIQKAEREKLLPLVGWAERERGFKFLSTETGKQLKALALAKENGLKAAQLKERWQEMAGDKFWANAGFDWMNVVKSFNKKSV